MEKLANFFPKIPAIPYQKEDDILLEGSRTQGIAIVTSGLVYTYRVNHAAITRIIAIEKPNALLGTEVVDDAKNYLEGARAFIDCQVIKVPLGVFDEEFADNPDFRVRASQQIIVQTEARNRTILRDLYPANLRIALFLEEVAGLMAPQTELPLTQVQLGQAVNSTTESVNRVLHELIDETDGAIQTYRKYLSVVNSPALSRYAERQLEKLRGNHSKMVLTPASH